jgi:hypothetical protein
VTKAEVQLVVVLVVAAAWLVGVILAVADGHSVLRATTPLMTGVVGWLFTEKATETAT